MKRNKVIKRAGIFCAAAAAFLCCVLPVRAASGVNVANRTQEEIRAYAVRDGVMINDPLEYAEAPVTSAPFAPGRLSDAALNSALKMLNQIRYIAGISDNVALDEQYNEKTQAAALVNYVNNTLSHTPSQPEGMSDELFALGQSGAGSSNIAWASWKGQSLNNTIVNSWMSDDDSFNISALGHRRWLLNPSMGKTGFGAVDGSRGTYSAVYSFDRSGQSAAEYGVMWPAQNMPIEYFNTRFPWSISMGKAVDASSVKVTLTRESDGQVWHFGEEASDGDFYVNNDGYGQKGCIIFRPSKESIGSYSDGDSYHVEITGLPDGNVSYTVNFFMLFKMERVDLNVAALDMSEGADPCTIQAEVIPSNATDQRLTWEISDQSVAAVSANGKKAVVTPQKAGSADILVKNSAGEVMAECKVTVNHVPGDGPDCVTDQICTYCKEVLNPALGHKIVTDEAVEAGCVTDGKTEGSHCSVCEAVIEAQKVIPKKGHAWVIDYLEEASPEADGMVTKTCSACGEKSQKTLSRPGKIRLSKTSYLYDGKPKMPSVTVLTEEGGALESRFYTAAYRNNIEAGTAKVTVTLKEHYTGTMTASFVIKKRSISSAAKAVLGKTSYTYDGRLKKPAVTVKDGGKRLTAGRDYALSYKNNTNVGTASAVITGKGNYTGKITKTFKILPKAAAISGKISAASKGFTVRWKKVSKSASGYQIQYATSGKFTKKTTFSKTVKKASTTKLTVKKLKSKKKYYVRVRTYKKVNGKTYYSNWSKVKSVSTKR